MLHEEVEQPRLWQRVGEVLQHLVGNQVASAALGQKAEGRLLYHSDAKVRISERNTKFTLMFHSEREYLQTAKPIKGTNKRAKNKVHFDVSQRANEQ